MCSPFNKKEMTYTQRDFDVIESYYIEKLKRERREKERACEIVNNLTYQLCKKNKEIQKLEYFIDVLTKGMNIAGEAMREMRKTVKKNG